MTSSDLPQRIQAAFSYHPSPLFNSTTVPAKYGNTAILQPFQTSTNKFVPSVSNRTRSSCIYEEQLLSSRVIYFSKTQVYWECSGIKASDAFPRGLPPLLWESVHSQDEGQGFRFNLRPFASSGAPYTEREIVHYDIWSSVVTAYSRKSLLHKPDRLTGLAGPANEMGKVIEDEYVVGHWKRSLSWSLLWRPLQSLDGHASAQPSPNPSWSWVGWNGALEVPKYFPGRCLLGDVVSVESFGNRKRHSTLTPTILRLCGRLSSVRVKHDPSTSKPLFLISTNDEQMITANTYPDVTNKFPNARELYALWTRSSRSSHLESSQFTMNAVLLELDRDAQLYTRRGICIITAEIKDANCEFAWSEEDILYESKQAQTINIR
jgi:hypothetical protein